MTRSGNTGAVALGAVSVALYLALAIGIALDPGEDPVSTAVWLGSFAVMALMGAAIVRARPRNAVGWVFAGSGIATMLASALGAAVEATGSGSLSALSLALFGTAWIALTCLPLCLFPNGAPATRIQRAGALAAAVLAAVLVAAVLMDPSGAFGPPSPLAVEALGGVPTAIIGAAQVAAIVIAAVVLASLAWRWRTARGLERRRLAWLGLGSLVFLLLAVAIWIGSAALPDAPTWVGALLEALQVVVVPLVVGAAIVDAQLFDITVALRVSLVDTAVAVIVASVFGASLAVSSALAGDRGSTVAAVTAAALVAVVVDPVRRRLDGAVEHLLYAERRRPEAAMTTLSREVSERPLDAGLLSDAAARVGESLRLSSVAIRCEEQQELDVAWGEPAGTGHTVALTAGGRRLGELAVTIRPGDSLSQADLRLLDLVAAQVALLVGAVSAVADLTRARMDLVGAREHERRRLSRELHDGVGPTLVGLALETGALAESLRTVSSDHGATASRIDAGLRAAIADLRRTVGGLRPAALDQLGLGGAVQELARQFGAGGIAVRVDARCGVLPPATEVAAFHITREALANVARHADASTSAVTLVRDGGALAIEVTDDGGGVAAGSVAGVGITSMRARAEELGGSVTVSTRATGGTVVRAVLPLEEGA